MQIDSQLTEHAVHGDVCRPLAGDRRQPAANRPARVGAIPKPLSNSVDDVFDVFSERQPTGAGSEDQHSGHDGFLLRRQPAEHLEVHHAELLEGHDRSADRPPPDVHPVAAVVDALRFLHHLLGELEGVGRSGVPQLVRRHALADLPGGNEGRAPVERLGNCERRAPCAQQRAAAHASRENVVGCCGGHIINLVRSRDPIFLGATQSVTDLSVDILRVHGRHFRRARQPCSQFPGVLVLRQPRERHHGNLRGVDHRRGNRSTQEVEEQEAAQLGRFFLRLGHVVVQLDRFCPNVAAVFLCLFSSLGHVRQVVRRGRVARIAQDERRQRAAHVAVKARSAFALQHPAQRRPLVGGKPDYFLIGLSRLVVQMVGEKLQRIDVHALVELVLLRVHQTGRNGPIRVLLAQCVRQFVRLSLS